MLLCDIGNTSYHFLDEGCSYKESVHSFNPQSVTKKVYYISVNSAQDEKLKNLKNWINIKDFLDMSRYYETMGVDRICALEALESGVVVDAGSAITVDVQRAGTFMGGFIYPGVEAMQKAYKSISPALAYDFNFSIDGSILPKNSQDAISYGYLKILQSEVLSHKLPIVLTGGDAHKLQNLFRDAKVDEHLLFRGMQKLIEQSS